MKHFYALKKSNLLNICNILTLTAFRPFFIFDVVNRCVTMIYGIIKNTGGT